MSKKFIVECEKDIRKSFKNYDMFFSDVDKPQDEQKVSGIYALKAIFDGAIPEILTAEFEWYENDKRSVLETGKYRKNINGIKSQGSFAIECMFYREYSMHYNYRSEERGYRWINGIYINKEIFDNNPPDNIYLVLKWNNNSQTKLRQHRYIEL
jgi:hypothetical protein